ncbi:MAG TPA: response regulator [Anaeromyxobacter sp.]|nr:response regulator [Anaeromyxobacter sp.]
MPRQGAVVLLVEDDADIRELMALVLSDEGYAVSTAENGLRGLELARERQPALIVLDLMMPVMSGWEFRAHQRADPSLAGVPVIVVSAAAPGSEPLEVAAYISKPFDFDVLVRTVHQLVVEGTAEGGIAELR